jgi:hypothetical protein
MAGWLDDFLSGVAASPIVPAGLLDMLGQPPVRRVGNPTGRELLQQQNFIGPPMPVPGSPGMTIPDVEGPAPMPPQEPSMPASSPSTSPWRCALYVRGWIAARGPAARAGYFPPDAAARTFQPPSLPERRCIRERLTFLALSDAIFSRACGTIQCATAGRRLL